MRLVLLLWLAQKGVKHVTLCEKSFGRLFTRLIFMCCRCKKNIHNQVDEFNIFCLLYKITFCQCKVSASIGQSKIYSWFSLAIAWCTNTPNCHNCIFVYLHREMINLLNLILNDLSFNINTSRRIEFLKMLFYYKVIIWNLLNTTDKLVK